MSRRSSSADTLSTDSRSSSTDDTSPTDSSDAPSTDPQSGGGQQAETDADLAAQLELLTEENRRLRRQYAQERRTHYRRTALGLGLIGLVALAGAVAFPRSRDVLFSLAAVGLFAGFLTYYLTPERFVSADVGRRVYQALAENESALVRELGLDSTRVYIPRDDSDGIARLFVPQRSDYVVPSASDADRVLVVTADDREWGLSLVPTGAELYREFERTRWKEDESTPSNALAQLADAVVEGFELADSVVTDIDTTDGRATIEVTNAVYAPARFDDPVVSFVAVGLAKRLDQPVTAAVSASAGSDSTVTYRWDDRKNSAQPK